MILFDLAKAELIRSNVDRRHPFRYLSLATHGVYPETRTVVKRKTTPELDTVIFTDARSPKVEQIRKNNKVSVLFYHPKKKLQIRINGEALLIEEGHSDYRQYFEQVKNSASIKDYTTRFAPGTPMGEDAKALFDDDVHFLAIQVVPYTMDILQLGTEKHERSFYQLEEKVWKETKLTP